MKIIQTIEIESNSGGYFVLFHGFAFILLDD